MFKSNTQLIIGIILGIIIMFIVYFFVQYKQEINSYKTQSSILLKGGTKVDTIQAGGYKIEIKQNNEIKVREQNALIEEKLNSFGVRIGDLYLSISLIITLLLAIVAGVYFKTESEVTKHMNKYYGKYKKDIEDMNAEAQVLLTQIQTKAELAEQILPRQQINQDRQEVAE